MGREWARPDSLLSFSRILIRTLIPYPAPCFPQAELIQKKAHGHLHPVTRSGYIRRTLWAEMGLAQCPLMHRAAKCLALVSVEQIRTIYCCFCDYCWILFLALQPQAGH